jgi:hypothetical protein
MRTRTFSGSVAAGAVMIAVAIGACTAQQPGSSSSPPAAAPSGSGSGAGPLASGSGGVGSNARSGPAEGGTAGTVASASTSSFTLTTPAGQAVTVNEASSTTYQNGTTSASTTASAITTGETVLVLGTTTGTTITATQVIVQPTGDYGSAASSAAGVVPFQQGAPSTAKQVGQIPNYTEGSGTIVNGTTADQATEAALAGYPGGVVDRVVQLSGGEYEVHNIGVNWPHHVFVDQSFNVVGAN